MDKSTDIVRVSEIGNFKGIPKTNSLIMANAFGKQHKDVLRIINNLDCPGDFIERNFALNEYFDSIGRALPMYEMTKNGFSLIAMGFTGKPAMEWKIKFINAFDELVEQNAALVKQNEELIKELQGELALASQQILYFCDDLDALEAKLELELRNKAKELGMRQSMDEMVLRGSEFYWNLCDARLHHSLSDVAKLIGTNYNQLLTYLRKKGLFMKDRPMPFQEAIDKELFVVKLQKINNEFATYAFFTTEGIDWIWREMAEDENS